MSLIKESKAGNLQAFDELISRYTKQIYNFAYRLIGNHHDAEDIVQETFIKMYRFIHTFRGKSAFSTWLYRIFYNTFLNEYKKKKRNPTNTPGACKICR